MARYHFHVLEGHSVIEDPDGSDLPDLQAAHAEAVSAIREILAEALRLGERTGRPFPCDRGQSRAATRNRALRRRPPRNIDPALRQDVSIIRIVAFVERILRHCIPRM